MLSGMENALPHPDGRLPHDVALPQALVRELLGKMQRLRQENEELRQRLDQALRHQFGPRSERTRPRRPAPEQTAITAAPEGHGRHSLPRHLLRERVVYDLTEAERPCPSCTRPRVCIGEQVSEQLSQEKGDNQGLWTAVECPFLLAWAGWSVGEVAEHTPEGVRWLVSGVNGENEFEVGDWDSRRSRDSVESKGNANWIGGAPAERTSPGLTKLRR
jgi:hypothetical protein